MTATLDEVLTLLKDHGATRVYAKKLSRNDCAKNQIYLGGDFTSLNILPFTNLRADSTLRAGSRRDRMKADVDFAWVLPEGLDAAEHANLILYPRYPEVRLSALLAGTTGRFSEVINTREEGRVLFFGITEDGKILGFATPRDSPISREIDSKFADPKTGVLVDIPITAATDDTRQLLLGALAEISQRGWIPGQRLDGSGVSRPYRSSNAGGYTLEAVLGIKPNGIAEPDYLGWEVKQYGVADQNLFRPKGVMTLMTPEPTLGVYREAGFWDFMMKYGYKDQSGIADRINFGGRYDVKKPPHRLTHLRLVVTGFDPTNPNVFNSEGGIHLIDSEGAIAAGWTFADLMTHWNKKHAKAVYVPSVRHPDGTAYAYGPRVSTGEGTNFGLFLTAVANGNVFLDPAHKIVGLATPRPKTKRRSQIRIKVPDLDALYDQFEALIRLPGL